MLFFPVSFSNNFQDEVNSIQSSNIPANKDATVGGVREVVITSNNPQVPVEFQNVFNQLGGLFNLNGTTVENPLEIKTYRSNLPSVSDPTTKWIFRFTNATRVASTPSQTTTSWNSQWRATWVYTPKDLSYTFVVNS